MGITAFFYATEGELEGVVATCRGVWPEGLGELAEIRAEADSAIEAIYPIGGPADVVFWQDGNFVAFAGTPQLAALYAL